MVSWLRNLFRRKTKEVPSPAQTLYKTITEEDIRKALEELGPPPKPMIMYANCVGHGRMMAYNSNENLIHCTHPECYWCREFEKELKKYKYVGNGLPDSKKST